MKTSSAAAIPAPAPAPAPAAKGCRSLNGASKSCDRKGDWSISFQHPVSAGEQVVSRSRRTGGGRPNWSSQHVAHTLLLLLCSSGAEATSDRQLYVALPRLGLISSAPLSGPPNKATAAFLGIPYAAPPIGPLRFMPPGGWTPAAGQQPALVDRRLLAPSNQRASVRRHAQPGKLCVHLPDWLEGPSPRNQSEDCLNLSIIVPIRRDPLNGRDSMRRPEIKSSASRSEADQESAASSGQSVQDNPSIEQDNQQPIWPLPPESPPLPVLVVCQTRQTAQSATRIQLELLASRTNSVVVTFNHRNGLLGFLPYADFASARSMWRHNHALWDHIGLLHWLKHNVAQFNGQPNNLTLIALDNEAAQTIQLLSMSPMAKGLFKRTLLLIHQQLDNYSTSSAIDNYQPLKLNQLLELAQLGPAKEARRRLQSTLSQTFNEMNKVPAPKLANYNSSQSQQSTPTATNNRSIRASDESNELIQFVQSANLSQLAKLNHQLHLRASSASDKMLALSNGPTLDDQLLFPQLSALIRSGINLFQLSPSPNSLMLANLTKARSEITYCLYMRQLYSRASQLNYTNIASNLTDSDPLAIVPKFFATQQIEGRRGEEWHSNDQKSAGEASSSSFNPFRRSQVAKQFNQLQNLHFLSQLMHYSHLQQQGKNPISAINNQLGENGIGPGRAGRSRGSNLVINKHLPRDRFQRNDDLEQLMELMASVEIMIGYFKLEPSMEENDNERSNHWPANYTNIIQSVLLNVQSEGEKIDDQLLIQLKWIEFHSISRLILSETSTISQFCDFRSMIGNLNRALPIDRQSSSFVFVAERDQSEHTNWTSPINLLLNPSGKFHLAFERFIKFGDPNLDYLEIDQDDYWPDFNLLGHKIRHFTYNSTENLLLPTLETGKQSSLANQIGIHLDLIPFLDQFAQSGDEMGQQLSVSSGEHLLNSNLADSIGYCLNELDNSIGRLRNATNQQSSGAKVNRQRQLADNLASELKCLASSTNKLRGEMRRYAAIDLEPLIMRSLERMRADSNSITARNLINHSSSAKSEVNPADQAIEPNEIPLMANRLEQWESANELLASNNNSALVAYVSSQNSPGATGKGGGETGGGIKGFFAQAYKDAIGQALKIVVCVGLIVFLLNLLIVVLVALKSSGRNRRTADSSLSGNGQLQVQVTDTGDHSINQVSEARRSTLKKGRQNNCPAGGGGHLAKLSPIIKQNKCQNNNLSSSSKVYTGNKRQLKFDLSGLIGDNNNSAQVQKVEYWPEHEEVGQFCEHLADGYQNGQVLFVDNHDHELSSLGCDLANMNMSHNIDEPELNQQSELIISAASLENHPHQHHHYHHLDERREIGACLHQQQQFWGVVEEQKDANEVEVEELAFCGRPISVRHLHQSPPLESQSQSRSASISTTTTTTTTGFNANANPASNQKQIYLNGGKIAHQFTQRLKQSTCNQFVLPIGCTLNHSTTSPSSSTTLSMTPIQLESLNNNHTNFADQIAAANNSLQHSQLCQLIEPISLLYESEHFLNGADQQANWPTD